MIFAVLIFVLNAKKSMLVMIYGPFLFHGGGWNRRLASKYLCKSQRTGLSCRLLTCGTYLVVGFLK